MRRRTEIFICSLLELCCLRAQCLEENTVAVLNCTVFPRTRSFPLYHWLSILNMQMDSWPKDCRSVSSWLESAEMDTAPPSTGWSSGYGVHFYYPTDNHLVDYLADYLTTFPQFRWSSFVVCKVNVCVWTTKQLFMSHISDPVGRTVWGTRNLVNIPFLSPHAFGLFVSSVFVHRKNTTVQRKWRFFLSFFFRFILSRSWLSVKLRASKVLLKGLPLSRIMLRFAKEFPEYTIAV